MPIQTDLTNYIIKSKEFKLQTQKIKNKNKKAMYHSIVESISTYAAETWKLNKKEKNRFLYLEMDLWRRSSRNSKLDHKRNERIREEMDVEGTILDTIESKRLDWYGHLERMNHNRWP